MQIMNRQLERIISHQTKFWYYIELLIFLETFKFIGFWFNMHIMLNTLFLMCYMFHPYNRI